MSDNSTPVRELDALADQIALAHTEWADAIHYARRCYHNSEEWKCETVDPDGTATYQDEIDRAEAKFTKLISELQKRVNECLARTNCDAKASTPGRIMKEALFALIRSPEKHSGVYGGVLCSEGGKKAWLIYTERPSGTFSFEDAKAIADAEPKASGFDFADFLVRKNRWSADTFGPQSHRGPLGPLDHLRKEIAEAEAAPEDVSEFADLIFLATDAAFRAGHTPAAIIKGLEDKLAINRSRVWPDWTEAPADKAIEHVRYEPKTTGWRDIESAPKDWSNILLYPAPEGFNDEVVVGYYALHGEGDEDWHTSQDGGGEWDVDPTHWQPLPPPPGQEEGENETIRRIYRAIEWAKANPDPTCNNDWNNARAALKATRGWEAPTETARIAPSTRGGA